MSFRKSAGVAGVVGMLCAVVAVPAFAQAARGKAELKAGAGAITVDYGRPSLKGRDMLSQLLEGSFWRMGMNQATVLATPVDLVFDKTRIAKGSYSLWLKKTGEKFELVFNSQTGQWGTEYHKEQDLGRIKMQMSVPAPPVERLKYTLTATGGNAAKLELAWEKHAGAVTITVK